MKLKPFIIGMLLLLAYTLKAQDIPVTNVNIYFDVIFYHVIYPVHKPLNPDSSEEITLSNFDKQVDSSIYLLRTKHINDISDKQHIVIIKCLNTISYTALRGGHYITLETISKAKSYDREVAKLYYWIPSRGMGEYFPKLGIEFYGFPHRFSIYDLINK